VESSVTQAEAFWPLMMARKKVKPGVSVALATYNGELFLREQLESLQSQSLLPAEIVISDDGSSDRTLGIVREVLTKAWCEERGVLLRFIENPQPLGAAHNFEQAILACSQPFVALADQDDVWHPKKLETLAGILQANPDALLVHSDARLVDHEGNPLGMTMTEGLRLSLAERAALATRHTLPAVIKRNLATGATMMFTRPLADVAFPLPEEEMHDGWLALVASLADGVIFHPEALIDYRQHQTNQIGGKPKSARESITTLLGSWRELRTGLKTRNADLNAVITRLGDLIPEHNKELVEQRIRHNEWRISLPSSRLFRVWPVLVGFASGRYRRCGRQPHDVLRDLLMPPYDVLLRALRFVGKRP